MKKIFTLIAFLSLTLIPLAAFAAQDSGMKAEVVNVGNTICPVSGEKIGSMGEAYKVTHNGKEYNLCCEMCVKDFKKNPEKYSKIAEAEAKKTHEGHDMGHMMNKKENHDDHGDSHGHEDHSAHKH